MSCKIQLVSTVGFEAVLDNVKVSGFFVVVVVIYSVLSHQNTLGSFPVFQVFLSSNKFITEKQNFSFTLNQLFNSNSITVHKQIVENILCSESHFGIISFMAS